MAHESFVPLLERKKPRTFSELEHAPQMSKILERLSQVSLREGLPHLCVYGNPGSGKFTRLMITLANLTKGTVNPYNSAMRAIDEKNATFIPYPGKKRVNVMLAIVSSCHCEIDLAQPSAKKALIPFLKYYCQTKSILYRNHKYVLLRHAHLLTHKQQCTLRRLIETRSRAIRFLITINSLGKLMPELRSRFLCLRLPSPSDQEAQKIMKWYLDGLELKLNNSRMISLLKVSKRNNRSQVNLLELLFSMEATLLFLKKKGMFRVYLSEEHTWAKKLFQALKSGNYLRMRGVLEQVYTQSGYSFFDVLYQYLPYYLLMEVRKFGNENVKKLYELIAHWDARKDMMYPLLSSEAYLFALVPYLRKRNFFLRSKKENNSPS